VRNLNVNVSPVADHKAAFLLRPDASATQDVIAQSRILLNGHFPEFVFSSQTSNNVCVSFDDNALRRRDQNYLLIEHEKTGRKSIYTV
jgi:hypothetical protein